MRDLVVMVRAAIVALVIMLSVAAMFGQEIVPGAHSGARFINGTFCAPGRYPGDGRGE